MINVNSVFLVWLTWCILVLSGLKWQQKTTSCICLDQTSTTFSLEIMLSGTFDLVSPSTCLARIRSGAFVSSDRSSCSRPLTTSLHNLCLHI